MFDKNAGVTGPEEYLSALEGERKEELTRLHNLIRETAPHLAPHMESGMIGYGRYAYRYPSGRSGEWPVLLIASRKQYISFYVSAATDNDGYLAESYKPALPKANIGKSCIRLKRLADAPEETLREIIEKAAAWAATRPITP